MILKDEKSEIEQETVLYDISLYRGVMNLGTLLTGTEAVLYASSGAAR